MLFHRPLHAQIFFFRGLVSITIVDISTINPILRVLNSTSFSFSLAIHPAEMASNGNPLPLPAHRPKSLMESLLVAKMEQVGHPAGKQLVRTDSADSASSMGSVASTTSDLCRCDDCLLGIADLYAQEAHDSKKKKVRGRHTMRWEC